jgi:hypothetical protein
VLGSVKGWQKALLYRQEPLNDLKQQLTEPLFQGVPLGYTLSDIITIDFLNGNLVWDFRKMLFCRPLYGYHWCRGLRLTPQPLPGETGRFLLTWLNLRQSLRDLVLPLLQALGPAQCTVIGGDPRMSAQLPAATGFLTWKGVPAFDLQEFRREYKHCAPAWHRRVKIWLRHLGLPSGIFRYLADALLTRAQMVMAYGGLLDRLQPLAVITEYDHHPTAACLILAAKARGIATMTMIHGPLNSTFAYTPLLADLAFCWGREHYDKLLGAGTEAERLVIAGCQRLSRPLRADSAAAKAKVGLPAAWPAVVLATNPIYAEHRKQLVRVFCQALAGMDRVSGVVRLHPSEKLDFYRPEIAAFPTIKFCANEAWTLDEALAAAEVVVCHNSGLGLDALVKGKLTVILDVLAQPLEMGEELIGKAGCPRARGADELAGIVARILNDGPLRRALQEKAASYLDYFIAAFGEDAAHNLAEIIRARAKPQVIALSKVMRNSH